MAFFNWNETSVKKLKDFKIFPNFPNEMRQRIFLFAAEGRTIAFVEVVHPNSGRQAIEVANRRPALMAVNREAMATLLLVKGGYKEMFLLEGTKKAVYFNEQLDTIKLDSLIHRNGSFAPAVPPMILPMKLKTKSDIEMITNLEVGFATFDLNHDWFCGSWSKMSALREFSVRGSLIDPTFHGPRFSIHMVFDVILDEERGLRLNLGWDNFDGTVACAGDAMAAVYRNLSDYQAKLVHDFMDKLFNAFDQYGPGCFPACTELTIEFLPVPLPPPPPPQMSYIPHGLIQVSHS